MLMAIVSISITLSLIIFSSYELLTKIALKNEEEIANYSKLQFENEISSIINNLSIVAADYGRWDDTYEHMIDFNEEYIKSNYINETFINNEFEMLLLIDDLGNINFEKAYSLENNEEIPIPEDYKEKVLEYWRFLYDRGGSNTHGIMVLPNDIAIISSQPVLTSYGVGPTRGTLIMGMYLDDNTIHKISEKMKLSIAVTNPSVSPSLDEEEVLANLSADNDIYIRPLSKETTSVYTVMEDLFGENNLLLRVDFPRTYFIQHLQSIIVFIFLAILTCLIIFMIFLIFLHKVVLNPLQQFTKEIVSIGNQENFSQRLKVKCKDELAILGNSVNSMLSSLETSHKKIAAITETIPDLVYIYDLQKNQYVYCNQQSQTILGYTSEELLDKSSHILLDLAHPEYLRKVGKHQEKIETTKDDEVLTIEIRAKHKRGHYLWLSCKDLVFQRTADGKVESILGIVQDITAKKLAEEELLQAKLEAEAASIAKSQFLANMSHELRTPMNGIIGLTEVLSLTPLNQEQKEYIELLRFSGDRLLSVINNVLDVSKLESQNVSLEDIPFDFHPLILGIIKDFSFRATKKGLVLTHKIDDSIPSTFIGDPHRLNQVLYNLLGNALKFTEEGAVHLEVSMDTVDEGKGIVHFSIKDTGVGIPKDKLHLLFNNFSQIDASTTRKYGGTGLGLAISKNLVELMGGRITVESQEDKGSIFTFSIPL